VRLVAEARARWDHRVVPIVVSGCIGPRGDGYLADERMSIDEARGYHSLQARAFAEADADLVTAITMTYSAEAAGLALAARQAGMPAVISFTVETDGSLPSGESLAGAIAAVDEATDAYPAYYMLNCAHPVHFAPVLATDAAWMQRIGGLRANASKMSHAELDAATELDAGDPEELAGAYAALRRAHPQLRVLGGCCGTNHVHVEAIARACLIGGGDGRDGTPTLSGDGPT
jgi:S-methylmethionine-dependent homocysteine/selenocysteine methylase